MPTPKQKRHAARAKRAKRRREIETWEKAAKKLGK
jgi:hypothetical protein